MSEEVLQLRIEDVAFGGSGVARHEGRVIFVPFTIEGEKVSARIFKRRKNFAEAALISVNEKSPHRIEARCAYFQKCGGCVYQHIDYARQLEIKSKQVEQTLQRVGKIESPPMRAIVPSPKPYGYRHRVRIHVKEGVVGYYALEDHRVIEIEQCPIASPAVNQTLREFRASRPRDGHYTLSEPGRPLFFTQTNDEVAAALLSHVRAMVKRDHTLLIDAYAGAGFFAKALVEFFPKVIGIELNRSAVEHARAGASAKEKYLVGEVGARLGELLAWHDADTLTLVLDPPATGLSPRVSEAVVNALPAEIIYVSCNPATLARDLAIISKNYHLESVTPFDMFPQTAEIEVVAHLRR